jgi:hypothetical protein
MTTTYRGVRLKVSKGRRWGYLRWTVNGVPCGDWISQDPAAELSKMRAYVDAAYERPEAYGSHWMKAA